MRRTRIAGKILRVAADFIETVEHFSDGSTEFAVYYFKSSVEAV